jgi:glycine cleavage system H protein
VSEESYPEELRYHPEHAWARVEGGTATFGITWYAQDNLSEVVYVETPDPGEHVTKDKPYAEVESIKAVSDVYAPLSGEVVEANGALADGAGLLNSDPYGQGWLVRVRLADPAEAELLMSADEYRSMIST